MILTLTITTWRCIEWIKCRMSCLEQPKSSCMSAQLSWKKKHYLHTVVADWNSIVKLCTCGASMTQMLTWEGLSKGMIGRGSNLSSKAKSAIKLILLQTLSVKAAELNKKVYRHQSIYLRNMSALTSKFSSKMSTSTYQIKMNLWNSTISFSVDSKIRVLKLACSKMSLFWMMVRSDCFKMKQKHKSTCSSENSGQQTSQIKFKEMYPYRCHSSWVRTRMFNHAKPTHCLTCLEISVVLMTQFSFYSVCRWDSTRLLCSTGM